LLIISSVLFGKDFHLEDDTYILSNTTSLYTKEYIDFDSGYFILYFFKLR